jgi:hypothetical protein
MHRFVYRQSPQPIPPGYDPVLEAEQILRQRQATLPPANPKAPSLWQQIRGVTVKSALSTPLRALGTIGLAKATFELGWKIGTGINAKFLRIGIPGDEQPSTYSSPEIHFRAQGQRSQLWYQIPVPEDAWVWSIYSSAFSWQRSMEYRGPGTTQCARQIFTPPPEFREVVIPMGCDGGPGDLRIAYLPVNALAAAGPIEDYTGQPYDRSSGAPAAPPQTTVEESIETELEKPENSLLRQWLNYQLGSPGETDPTGIGPRNPIMITVPDCEATSYAECSQDLNDAGFQGTITRDYASFEGADVTKPAGVVLETQPAAGIEVEDDGEVVITTNPEDADMPRVVPAPTAHETGSSYQARLEALDLVPTREVVTYTPGNSWAGDVLSTSPAAGARARKGDSVEYQAAWRPEALYSPEEQQETDCEPSEPRYEPAGDPFAVGDPPSFFAAEGIVLFWKGDLTTNWGERHIAAKHGWDGQDKLDTTTTLATPLFVIRDRPSENALEPWLYAQLMPERNGKPCVRIVRVERGQWPAEPYMRGVITSFGAVATFLP